MNGTCPCISSQANQIPSSIQSWNDLQVLQPKDPTDLIAWANITGPAAAFTLSSTYLGGPWVASPFSIGSISPKCVALGTDSIQNVADADQWNFQHLTSKAGDPTLAPPLTKLIFLRAGTQWKNSIQIAIGGATYNDLQLSFRDNAATRGDCRATIPVIAFTGGALTNTITLDVVLKTPGHFMMGLRAIDTLGNKSMFEMEWVVV